MDAIPWKRLSVKGHWISIVFRGIIPVIFCILPGQIEAIQLGESCVGPIFLHPKFWQTV